MNYVIQSIRLARQEDLRSLQAFLSQNNLRTSIELTARSLFYYILHDGKITGMIGAEFNQQYALIRGAGIAQPWRRQGIAQILFQHLETELEKRGVTNLYLFSRQAAEFWTKMGFTQCTIEEVINVLSDTPQVKEFIADNSIWTDVAWHKPKHV